MSEQPEIVEVTAGYVRLGRYEGLGFGELSIRSEGAPTEFPYRDPVKPSWLSRVTEWPRRKLARALERVANWVCRDRDKGW